MFSKQSAIIAESTDENVLWYTRFSCRLTCNCFKMRNYLYDTRRFVLETILKKLNSNLIQWWSNLDKPFKEYLYELFDKTIDARLEKNEKGLNEPIPTVVIQRTTNVLNFVEAIFRPQYRFKGKREDKH